MQALNMVTWRVNSDERRKTEAAEGGGERGSETKDKRIKREKR